MPNVLKEGSMHIGSEQEPDGLVGLLAKHRRALDPSFNPKKSDVVKSLHAMARALIEAFGGAYDDEAQQYVVDLHVGPQVDLNVGASRKRLDELESRIKALESAAPRTTRRRKA